jgi:purine-binding chemotaxis protein CheW
MALDASAEGEAANVNDRRQVLTFSLGGEHYGVDILRVQEIRGWSPVTRIPKSAPHVLGVLNLRGAIVPILDLRVRFDLPQAEFTPLTVIIVLSFRLNGGTREFGLVVDAVSDVIDIAADHLKQTPNLGSRAAQDFVQGLAIVGERMLILLNTDELIRRDMEQVAASDIASVA